MSNFSGLCDDIFRVPGGKVIHQPSLERFLWGEAVTFERYLAV